MSATKPIFLAVSALGLALAAPGMAMAETSADDAAVAVDAAAAEATTSDDAQAAAPATTAEAAPAATVTDIPGSLLSSGSGRLLLTGGVSQVEGSAGGGLTPWAFIAGYGTNRQIGGTAYATYVKTDDYNLKSYGGAIGLFDRVEVSLSRQEFDLEKVGGALGLGNGFTISQTTVGVKVKLIGNGVLDQDKLLPQISVGLQYKDNNRDGLVKALGATSGNGVDFYLTATKLFLGQNLLLNGTVRLTKANQFGILGFGSATAGYKPQFEGSVAYLVTRKLAIGAEVRTKPNNLAVAKEGAAFDAFVAFAPSKNISVTAAYVNLGNIVVGKQDGYYLSLQFAF